MHLIRSNVSPETNVFQYVGLKNAMELRELLSYIFKSVILRIITVLNTSVYQLVECQASILMEYACIIGFCLTLRNFELGFNKDPEQ